MSMAQDVVRIDKADLYAQVNVRDNDNQEDEVQRYVYRHANGKVLAKVTIVGNWLVDPQVKDDSSIVQFNFNSHAGQCQHQLRGDDTYHLLADAYFCTSQDGGDIDFTTEGTGISGCLNNNAPVAVTPGVNRLKFTKTKHYAFYDEQTEKSVLKVNKECLCNNCPLAGQSDQYECLADGTWQGGNLDLDNNCGNA